MGDPVQHGHGVPALSRRETAKKWFERVKDTPAPRLSGAELIAQDYGNDGAMRMFVSAKNPFVRKPRKK